MLPKNPFKGIGDRIPDWLDNIRQDSDTREKNEVYIRIANYLQKKYNVPENLAFKALKVICDKNIKYTTKSDDSSNNFLEVRDFISDILISISVTYQRINKEIYKREIELIILNKQKPKSIIFEEEIEWDYLPPDVREDRLRNGTEIISFDLYTKN